MPLTLDKINMYCKPVWTPKRWAWIDPRSEAMANQIAIKSGLKAPSQIIKEMGGDPEEVWETVKTDMDMMKEKGIPEEIVAGIFAEKAPTVAEILGEMIGGMPDESQVNLIKSALRTNMMQSTETSVICNLYMIMGQ